jgi:acetyl-CoA synthetase
MLKHGKTYEEIHKSFQWKIPQFFNMGSDICDKWAYQRYRLALIYLSENGKDEKYTFWDLRNLSNKFVNGLRNYGISKGDRIGIILSQCPEAVICHLAAYKMGAIAVPLSDFLGVDAIEYRLSNCEVKAVISDEVNFHKIMEVRENLPNLKVVILTKGEKPEGVFDFWTLIEKGSSDFKAVKTKANDPALIIYTSGTTGPPKGAVHPHKSVLTHLPCIELAYNLFPKKDDFFWTPAPWAWVGGLLDGIIPTLHHGVPILAYRSKKFDPEEAFYLIAKYGIRNTFMPPTVLRLLKEVKDPKSRYNYNMRSIACGGETLGEETLNWGREVMGLTINEWYGQTEFNLFVTNCSEIMEVKPGSMGREVPGHIAEVVDDSGVPVSPGTEGEIVLKRPDPVEFLGYWKNDEATKEKYTGEWCLTGDLGKKDEDGYFWFIGRKDDIITSAGYRIGPGEIEDCILKHSSVGLVAVVGSPDELRTEVVKAFIVLKTGVRPSPNLESDIKNFVKIRLAAHEYPREIEFVDQLPITSTGKIMRKELRKMEMQRKLKHKPFGQIN